MIIKNVTYKGVSLSEANGLANNLVLQTSQKNVRLQTQIFNKVNYHGAYSTPTVSEGRLFAFTGTIFGNTRADRQNGQDVLNSIIKPEIIPSATNTGFYELTWEDDGGTQYKVQAKVYSMPEYNHEIGTDIIRFSFSLYSDSAIYQGTTDKSSSGNLGLIGGNTLPNVLPHSLDNKYNSFNVTNSGDFGAPCRIVVTGSCQNPKITNLTNGRYYKLDGITTTNLVIDNTSSPFVVTNEGVNVRGNRASGSTFILLDPGVNELILTSDNFSFDSTVTIDVYFNDTYIKS